MNEPPNDLRRIQSWIHAVITNPDGIDAGIGSEKAQSQIRVDQQEVESVVTRSRDLTATERLAIYGNAYFARLLECMRDLFPALQHALGDELFDEFAVGYLEQHPPHSYTLGKLADQFVEFLEATRPALDEEGGEGDRTQSVGWPDFLVDLARLEWTIDRVFDAPGVEDETLLTADQLRAIPPDAWPDARLTTVRCLRLLEFRFPVNSYYTKFREGAEPELPDPANTYLALSRRDYVVRRFELSKSQFHLLQALSSGSTVGHAIGQLAAHEDDLDQLSASLQNWFHLWSSEGLFEKIELTS